MLGLAHRLDPVSISDDDYARVVIAQRFAEAASLDPSGTSWLPLPFWLTGAAMRLFGASLLVARWVQVATSVGAALLLFGAARRLGCGRWFAVASALLTALLPTLRPLQLATVPEYWTAALATYGLSTLVVRPSEPDTSTSHESIFGALALAAATLCRYEIWPLAGGFAIACLTWRDIGRRGAALLACAGMLAWCAHGWWAHGSPFFFIARVAHYKAALDGGTASWGEALLGYPVALLTREPEVTAACLAAVAWGAFRGRVALLPPLALGLAVLIWGDVRGGTPTHHPERALLTYWMLAVPLSLATLTRLAGRWGRRETAALVLGAALVATGTYWLRARREPTYYVERHDEQAIGTLVARQLAPSERVTLATDDYGYLAIQAAAGHPDRFVIADHHDPRAQRITASPVSHAFAVARASGTPYLVIPVCWDLDQVETLTHSADFRLVRLKSP
ncbi:MAG TPA: glycosyltransferase family 39 protein [Polyangiaceae bacterium]|nr:glycosyltransferase family 39 protein [Polyangiaceae bacterium]